MQQLGVIIAAADATGVVQLARWIEISDMERAEADPAACGRRPSQDGKFLALSALDLKPLSIAAGPVWRCGLLADDALQPHRAHMAEEFGRVPIKMSAVTEHALPI